MLKTTGDYLKDWLSGVITTKSVFTRSGILIVVNNIMKFLTKDFQKGNGWKKKIEDIFTVRLVEK